MKNIFVYGSLMNDEVFSHLIKGNFQKFDATLNGYRRVKVVGKAYPSLRRDSHCRVEGLLIAGLSFRHLFLLDKFEGKLYKRITVVVNRTQNKRQLCETYIFKNKYRRLLLNENWCNNTFREQHMKNFMRKYFI